MGHLATTLKQLALFDKGTTTDYFDNLCDSLQVPLGTAWPDTFGASLLKWWKRSRRKPLRTLSLFSGLGGLDIAFHDAGFDITTLLEIDERFVRTLRANARPDGYLSECDVMCMDVRDFDASGIEADFIIGGPPCQSFSAAARRASGVSGINDDKGVLFRDYVRILDTLRPQCFVFENVYGITGANRGKAWADIQAAFEEVGYQIFSRILDAADYGVPQHRERMFIIGIERGASPFLFPRPTHGPDSLANRPYYSAGEAIEGTLALSDNDLPAVGGRYAGLLEQIPPGLNYSFFTEKMGHPQPIFAWRSKFSDFLYKADPETPVRTLKAQGGQYTGPFHWDSRPFSVSELKRLQTIPDAYGVSGGRQVTIHQIGNSVPPQLARLLAISILDQVFHVAPPTPISYLRQNEQLGFRSRKRALTSVYRDKAVRAIVSNGRVKRGASKPRKYKAFLTPDFDLRELTAAEHANISIAFFCDDSRWRIHASTPGSHPRKKLFEFRVRPKHDWTLPVPEVLLTGNSFTKDAFTGVWKAFEGELIRQHIKADVVQLCGYYQYNPAIAVTFEASRELPSNDWKVLALVCEGVGVRSTIPLTDLAHAWGVPATHVLSHCVFLKTCGFEVRNSQTNPEIRPGYFLVPYAFPTLNPKSVQLRKHLVSR